MGLGDLAGDLRFRTNEDRVNSRDALRSILSARLAERPYALAGGSLSHPRSMEPE